MPTHLVVTLPSGMPLTQFTWHLRSLLFTLKHSYILFWNPCNLRGLSKVKYLKMAMKRYSTFPKAPGMGLIIGSSLVSYSGQSLRRVLPFHGPIWLGYSCTRQENLKSYNCVNKWFLLSLSLLNTKSYF